jgi:hypothetical protein
VGDLQVLERVLIPAESHKAELEDATAALADLLEKSAGKPEAVQRVYARQIELQETRVAVLSALPETTERVELRPTGKTYRQG